MHFTSKTLRFGAGTMLCCLVLCSCDGYKQMGGTILGGTAGSMIGGIAGGEGGALVGGIAGAIAGGMLGKSMDDADRRAANQAATVAFTEDRPVRWERRAHDGSMHRGSIKPIRRYHRGDYTYRDFESVVKIDGKREIVHGTARRRAGSKRWELVSSEPSRERISRSHYHHETIYDEDYDD